MDKKRILEILEGAKDDNGEIPMSLVRKALKKIEEPCTDTVSRQAAIDAMEEHRDKPPVLESDYDFGRREMLEACIDEIESLPSAQPEIIHCKDCCHYPGEHTDCPLIGWGRNENDFCSWAERINE